jgi:hypothetical protein
MHRNCVLFTVNFDCTQDKSEISSRVSNQRATVHTIRVSKMASVSACGYILFTGYIVEKSYNARECRVMLWINDLLLPNLGPACTSHFCRMKDFIFVQMPLLQGWS